MNANRVRWNPPLASGEPVRMLSGSKPGPETGVVVATQENEMVTVAAPNGEILFRAAESISRINIFGESTWPCCKHCEHGPVGRQDSGHTVPCELCSQPIPVHPSEVTGWCRIVDLAAELMATAGGDPAELADRKGFVKGLISVTLHMGSDGPQVAQDILRREITRVTLGQ